MGSWKLEIFRMGLYVSFPVGMFLTFNSPYFYEEAILEGRRSLMRHYDKEGSEDLIAFLKEQQKESMARQIEEIKQRKPNE